MDDLLQSLLSAGSADTRPSNPQEGSIDDMEVNVIPGSSENIEGNIPDQTEAGTDIHHSPLESALVITEIELTKCFNNDKEGDGGEDDNDGDYALNDGDGDNEDYDLYGK